MSSDHSLPEAGARIVTITLNPTIDTAFEAEKLVPTEKIRTSDERLDPGGGGINVARVLARFGAPVQAIHTAGGSAGHLLDRLLEQEGVEGLSVGIKGDTRVSVTVHERSTGLEYRFVPEGPELSDAEWQECLERVDDLECGYVVASGSLPRGVPEDFYGRVSERLARRSIRFVLDTSGEELKAAVTRGGIFLLKPSRSELEELVGHPLGDLDSVAAEALRLVAQGASENVAVTMGKDGAILANRSGATYVPAVPVEAKSSVGAGDSFLAAMTFAFASGAHPAEALRLGIAAGAAATLYPGTNLCRPDDVRRLASEEQPQILLRRFDAQASA